jgi:hypothetical protein
MENDLVRAQSYRNLAARLRKTAEDELDEKRRIELLELANQYDGLVVNLVKRHAGQQPA